jgi:acid phosphatase (class A)
MQAVLMLVLLAGSLLWPPGTVAMAQTVDPAGGLNLKAERYRAVVGRPPAPGSAAEADDLAVLRWNERTRYPEAVVHSWRFLHRNLSTFDAAIGSDLGRIAPTVFRGLPAFLKPIDVVKDALKEEIARPRPYVSELGLKPCLPLEDTFSYPSGHATWYAAASMLLADLLPERRERLLEVGLQGGYARSYCVVHYPSDVLASQRLAGAISRDVIASPQWQAFKQQLRPELQKLLVAPPAGLPLLSD